jgi:hypothetical protein
MSGGVVVSKKILYIGVFNSKSTCVWQADGFEELGYEVIRYDYRQRKLDLKRGSIRDNEIINICNERKPGLIIFAKCNKMSNRAVIECRKIGKTALWYPDGANQINKELIDKMIHCDFFFCSSNVGKTYGLKHCGHYRRVQCGYNPKTHYPIDLPKTMDVSFIGQIRDYRKEYKKAVKFQTFSNVYNEEHSKVVSQSKINLNFTKGAGTSNRLYKLMAAGGFVLTNTFDTMEEDFVVGQDLDVFSSPKDLQKKINYYLKNEEERKRIAATGCETVKKYDNKNYARVILSDVFGE